MVKFGSLGDDGFEGGEKVEVGEGCEGLPAPLGVLFGVDCGFAKEVFAEEKDTGDLYLGEIGGGHLVGAVGCDDGDIDHQLVFDLPFAGIGEVLTGVYFAAAPSHLLWEGERGGERLAMSTSSALLLHLKQSVAKRCFILGLREKSPEGRFIILPFRRGLI